MVTHPFDPLFYLKGSTCAEQIPPDKRGGQNVADTRDGISAFVEDRNLVILEDLSYKSALGHSGRSFLLPTDMGRRRDTRMSVCPTTRHFKLMALTLCHFIRRKQHQFQFVFFHSAE